MIISRISTALCLACAIAVGAAWVNSYRWEDCWRQRSVDASQRQTSTLSVRSGRGLLLIEKYSFAQSSASEPDFRRWAGASDWEVWRYTRERPDSVPQWTPPFFLYGYRSPSNAGLPVNDQLRFHWVNLHFNDGLQHHWSGIALPYWVPFLLTMSASVVQLRRANVRNRRLKRAWVSARTAAMTCERRRDARSVGRARLIHADAAEATYQAASRRV
jgi:hypothetical protein